MAISLTGCSLHDVNNDRGGAINLALGQGFVLVARGESGLDVVGIDSGAVLHHLDPTGDSDSFDDVTSNGKVLLVHDADDGYVSSYLLDPSGALTAATIDLEVESGPYSGVSMSGGVAVISGGTCGLTVLSVGDDGQLAIVDALEAFRGLPDVTVEGSVAVLSTHFSGDEDEFVDGQEFGITTLDVATPAVGTSAGLAGAGFTEGGGRPASWPVRVAMLPPFVLVAHGGGFESFRIDGLTLTDRQHLDAPFIPIDVTFTTLAGGAIAVGVNPPTVAHLDLDLTGAISLGPTIPLSPEAQPTAVVSSGPRVFVADPDRGLEIVDAP